MRSPTRFALAGLSLLAAGLAGCASTPTLPSSRGDTGLVRIERLTLDANRCWFKSNDPDFTGYTLAPELSSYSGRPRFLLVPRGQEDGLPLLVVEGREGQIDIAAYGPLMSQPIGTRIRADLNRWIAGDDECKAWH
ncbi:hypothetical protein [Jiella sp. M17.18]|uniref:hypothetical protein n=1 Tax=Jiella sp. M17.18 TaxID=3234247 RepID=UPI0034DFA3A9